MSFTNAQLAQKISDLIDFWSSFNVEYANWLGGVVGGGPGSNGAYPLTDYSGATSLVDCPAQLADDVNSLVTGAQGYANAASASATTATTQAGTATTQAGLADAARILAEAAQTAAELAETGAVDAKVTAIAQANLATDRAGYAAEWANNDFNVLVSVAAGGNGVDEYSAKHWAEVASGFAGDIDANLYARLSDNEVVTGAYTFSANTTFTGTGIFNALSPAIKARAGDGIAVFNADQIQFGHNGTDNYRHGIGTRHNAGADANNAIDFYLWNFGTDAAGALGTFQVMTLDQTGSNIFTGLGVWGDLTAGAGGQGGDAPFTMRSQYAGAGWNYMQLQNSGGTRIAYLGMNPSNDFVFDNEAGGSFKFLDTLYANTTFVCEGVSTFNGQVTVQTTGSQITVYDTDGTDSLDRGLFEINADTTNVYAYDNSAAAWYLGLSISNVSGNTVVGNATGDVYVGSDLLYVNSKLTISANDSYLRLNQGNAYTSGVYTPYNFRADGTIYIGNGTVGLSLSNGAIKHTTASGWVEVGAQNTTYCHFSTDRGQFYMNKPVHVNGTVYDYNAGSARPYFKLASPTGYTSGGNVTYSTSAPSGGSSGDLWFKYT